MGYYTYYSLEVTNLDWSEETNDIDHVNEINNNHDWYVDDNAKWYEWENTMRDYSKLYPDLLFILDWEWEEQWDIWRAYFNNWLMQYEEAKIIRDDFNINKLK